MNALICAEPVRRQLGRPVYRHSHFSDVGLTGRQSRGHRVEQAAPLLLGANSRDGRFADSQDDRSKSHELLRFT